MSEEILTSVDDRPAHEHLWGWEEWVVNTEEYCGKVLHLNPGFVSSVHYHKLKDETFMAVQGRCRVTWWPIAGQPPETTVLRGTMRDAIRLHPGTAHCFEAVGGMAFVVEFSTHHSEEDVVRLQEARRCNG